MMRICFVSHSSGNLGSEAALLELIDAMSAENKSPQFCPQNRVIKPTGKIKIFAVLPQKGPLYNELQRRNIPIYILPYKSWMYQERKAIIIRAIRFFYNLVLSIFLAKKIRKWNCDLVYTNTLVTAIGAFGGFIAQKPHCWHIHEFGWDDHGYRFDVGRLYSYWLMNKLTSTFICISNAVAQKHATFFPQEKIHVIEQSVTVYPEYAQHTLGESVNVDQNALQCIIIGSITPGKRQEDAIKAIELMNQQGLHIQLQILGERKGNYYRRLQHMVRTMNLDRQVFFLGYKENFFHYITMQDVLLVCSLSEGFGRTTVYGMLAGKAVIGAESGHTKELIKHGINGLLYSSGDYHSLAKRLTYLYHHRDEAIEMGKRAKNWASTRFTQDRYGKEMRELFENTRYVV